MAALKKHCKRSHFSVVKVNNGADDYCNKEDTRVDGPWSEGVRPARHNSKGDKARRTRELLAMGPEQALMEGHVTLGQGYLNLVRATELYNLRQAEAVQTESHRGLYYLGPSGVGKSHKARTENPDAYIKDQSKWFDGYTGQQTIILDDLDSDCLSHHLKIWADKWKAYGEFKGGKTALRHTKFIVTSQYPIEELFKDKGPEAIEAITRRFEVTIFRPRI